MHFLFHFLLVFGVINAIFAVINWRAWLGWLARGMLFLLQIGTGLWLVELFANWAHKPIIYTLGCLVLGIIFLVREIKAISWPIRHREKLADMYTIWKAERRNNAPH